jgi:iron(III) transport system ATP-binding protein
MIDQHGVELTVEELSLRYGSVDVLEGVSMQLRCGEVVSLLGSSGSGKTTLLRAVAGLETPSSGRITLGQRIVFDGDVKVLVPAQERNLGLVFQSYALWPHKTVFENVAYGLQLRKVPRSQIRQAVERALSTLALGELGERYPHQLSGGQQQRVAMARALVYNPPVILLDEPLSNLDAKLREEARAWLRELIVTMRLSALVVTHDQSEALAMSDRILLLNGGRIEQQGTPMEIYRNPQTRFAAQFMGSNNVLSGLIGDVQGRFVRLDGEGWSVWGWAKQRLSIGAKASGILRVEQAQVSPPEGFNRVSMTLVTSMCLGDRWEYFFKLNDMTLRVHGAQMLESKQYQVGFAQESLWVFE